MGVLKALAKQPYWIIALVIGAAFVGLPCVTVDKDYRWTTHAPNTYVLFSVGISLLALSFLALFFGFLRPLADGRDGAGLDLTKVTEKDGVFSTCVSGCVIRVTEGRIEDYPAAPGTAVVLPCNEYFDDECAGDTKSVLGAYVGRVFDGQVEAFVQLIKERSRRNFGQGTHRQKTREKRRRASDLADACC